MRTTSSMAVAQQQPSDLDSMAYGQRYAAPPAGAVVLDSGGGGALSALRATFAQRPRVYAQSPGYAAPGYVAPGYAAPVYATPVSAPPPQIVYSAPVPQPMTYDGGYRLDAGDKLRVVVYGQDGLTNSYAIDAGGSITMPLIGLVPARGRTTAELASEITGRLRGGYIREPSVAVEIEAYRPFFILGEVAAPGQYPYVPNMSVESAVAIAGGFSPRARRDRVTVTHNDGASVGRYTVPLGTAISPGDTVVVGERWF